MIALLLAAMLPIHGRVLALPAPRAAIVAVEAAPGALAAQTRRYRLASATPLRPGAAIDAYLDVRRETLSDVHVVDDSILGITERRAERPYAKGDLLPDVRLEDQRGHLVGFPDLRGKTTLLSFVYTRCPDREICPAISGKFAYLQHRLDPARYHLVELTIDPSRDSPPVLDAYGAQFGADPARWSLLTGERAQVRAILDRFLLAPIEQDPGRIIHGDTLAILDRDGRIAELIPTAGWVPDDVIAAAESIDGSASNPLRRLELASIAGIAAFCGGDTSTGLVILDSFVFVLGVGVLGGILIWVGKRVILDERY